MLESRICAGATKKYQGGKNLTHKQKRGPTIWKDMLKKCVERCCELAKKNKGRATVQSFSSLFGRSSVHKGRNWNQLDSWKKFAHKTVLKCLYLERIGRPDKLLSVNELARSVTQWTEACDKRLARLISYIHHTNDFRQYCHVGHTAQHCRRGLFRDSELCWCL